ncbi:MAG: hypothetical protein HUJ24_07485 [Rhodobacteraceae bacterium]|nr:hypothetical protein [Paracoccaceae bacterium]
MSFLVPCADCGGSHEPAPNDAFDDLVRTACTALDESFVPLYRDLGLDQPGGRWNSVDQRGELHWTTHDGRSATSAFQFIGTWAPASETFKWGWDHPYATPATRAAADMTRQEGAHIGSEVMTCNLIGASEPDTWHLTKIAAWLSGLPATYRAKVNDKAWWYIAFDHPRWNEETT